MLLLSEFAYAGFENYDLAIYGNASTGFWEHNYYRTSATSTPPNTLVTHTGKDFQLGDNSAHVPIKSYGFGKVINIDYSFNAPTIRHLMNDGKYINVNLLHLHEVNDINNKYITKYQLLGREGNKGLGFNDLDTNTHLHFEVAGQISLAWVPTAEACLGNGCVNGVGRSTVYDIDDFSAYYRITSNAHRELPFNNRVWYNPDTLTTHTEAIPFMSMKNNPSSVNYDVYGVADKPLYGNINLSGYFQTASILVRDFSLRTNAETVKGGLDDNHRFLGKLENQSIRGINGNNSYAKGDYLFLGYIFDNGVARFGYPIQFSLVNNGDFIIDNDQSNADADQGNDARNTPTYNGTIIDRTTQTNIGSKVPGYFLTADLFTGRSNAFAQWKPYKSGTYKIYVHIPENNVATATNVRYIIKKDGTDTTAINSKVINQSTNADNWVQIIGEDNTSSFQFNENGYIGLSLSNLQNATNYSIDATRKVAFDAIRFESLITEKPTAPSSMSVSTTSNSASVSWSDSSSNEDGFYLYRYNGNSWQKIATLGANITSYMDSGLVANTTYYYSVQAYNSAGAVWTTFSNGYISALTKTFITVPTAPSSMSVSTTSSSVSVSWSDNSSNEDGFYLYRYNGSSWQKIATLGANNTSYTDSGLVANTTYYYSVQAYNSAGAVWTTFSNGYISALTKTTITKPIAPSTMSVYTTSNSVNVFWNDNSNNEAGFYLYRWNGSSWQNIATLGANVTSYNNTGLASKTTYYYTVVVYNSAGSTQTTYGSGYISATTK